MRIPHGTLNPNVLQNMKPSNGVPIGGNTLLVEQLLAVVASVDCTKVNSGLVTSDDSSGAALSIAQLARNAVNAQSSGRRIVACVLRGMFDLSLLYVCWDKIT